MISKDKSDVSMRVLMGISYDFKTGRFFRGNGKETFLTVNNGRRVAMVEGKMIAATRFAWQAFWGHEPEGNITTWNNDPMDVRILNLREMSGPVRNVCDEVWFDPYSSLIFRKGSNEELFTKGRHVEYVAGKSWSKWRLVDAMGIKPGVVIVHDEKMQWIVRHRGRIVAKRFQSYEGATGWVEANNQRF